MVHQGPLLGRVNPSYVQYPHIQSGLGINTSSCLFLLISLAAVGILQATLAPMLGAMYLQHF